VYEKPGRYIVRLTATGTNGLPLLFIDSVIIPEAKVSLSALSWKACAGHPITWQLTGTNTSNFVWDYGDGSTGLSQNGTHVHAYADPGTYAPSLLMKDTNGCVTAAIVSNKVTVQPKPVIQLLPAAAAMCEGQSLKLTATGGTSYAWSPSTDIDNINSQSPTVKPMVSTTYKVMVTDANGCTNEKELPVTVHHPITLSLDGDTTLCQGDSKTFIASGAHHYTWIDHTEGLSSLQSSSPQVTPTASGMYTLVGYDAPGCFTDTAVASITVHPRPLPDAGIDVEIEAGKKVPLQATAGAQAVSWSWSPATYLSCSHCASPVCIPLADTKYTATATNQFGCAASDDVLIKLVCDESKVRIPNGFTPNGDGNNDLFMIKGISFVKHLTIYNRWGNKVFERHHFVAADAGASWDGKLQGIPQPTGTYVYFVEMQCNTGGIFTRKGTITLIR
jgi:gliding motility-associated-like protein